MLRWTGSATSTLGGGGGTKLFCSQPVSRTTDSAAKGMPTLARKTPLLSRPDIGRADGYKETIVCTFCPHTRQASRRGAQTIAQSACGGIRMLKCRRPQYPAIPRVRALLWSTCSVELGALNVQWASAKDFLPWDSRGANRIEA